MAEPARQLDAREDRREWLSVDEAAEVTGDSVRTWRWRAKKEHDTARREGRDSLAMKRKDGADKAGWHVARSIDRRLTVVPVGASPEELRPMLLGRYPGHAVDLAYRRLHWLTEWRKRCDRCSDTRETDKTLAASVVAEAQSVEGRSVLISVRSLRRWHQVVNRVGSGGQRAGVEALIDRRMATTVADSDGTHTRNPAAVEYFYDVYRTENKLAAQLCHDATCREARRNGWQWPSSYTATTRWLRDHDDVSLSFLMRFGKDRWASKFLAHIETDEDAIVPGELFVCDHHECDFWVTYKDKQIRPWMSAVQDRRSRCIVGWHIGPAPHTDAIVASLRTAFRDWSIPRVMRVDNGKDYTSKMVTGVTKAQRDRLRKMFGRHWKRALIRNARQTEPIDSRWLGITGELEIELIYAIPYSPWSKGTLERWFGTFEGQHGKTYVTYCGNSTVNRPECLAEIRSGYTPAERKRLQKRHGDDWRRHAMLKFIDQRDIPTLEEARKRVGEYIELYHLSEHRGEGMHGSTPLAVWRSATSLRRAVENDLMCLMDVRGVYRVTANGVRVTIGSAPITYGKGSAALKKHVGRDVLVMVDPDDISHCWAFTPDRDKRRPIGRLEANERIAPATCADDAREAIAEQMRERSVMHKARRTSAKHTRTMAQRMNEHGRAQLEERRRTGTDDRDEGAPRIVPVPTGFEGASSLDRSGFDNEPYERPDVGEAEDLFDDDPIVADMDEQSEEDRDVLFDDNVPKDGEEDGLDSIL